jgi:hypothetical protein
MNTEVWAYVVLFAFLLIIWFVVGYLVGRRK